MKPFLVPILIFVFVSGFSAFFWKSEPGEGQLHMVLVIVVALSGGLSAKFIWFHPEISRLDETASARGGLRGVFTGVGTVLIGWFLFSVVMYFLMGRQLQFFNVVSQYAAKFLLRFQRGYSALVFLAVNGLAGLVAKKIAEPSSKV